MSGTSSATLNEAYNLYWRDNSNTDNLFYNISGGNNSVLQNPLFENAEAKDFHLTSTSPAFNAGNPNFDGTNLTDLDGNVRVSNGRVDIGAFELLKIEITIDGISDDWQHVSNISSNATIELKAHTDNSALHLSAIGGLNGAYQVFINSDNNTSSGFIDAAWSSSGADYLIENGTLYKHNGSGWNWTFVASLSSYRDNTIVEVQIPLSLIENISNIIYIGYKDLSGWTVAATVPVQNNHLAEFTIDSSKKALVESFFESQIVQTNSAIRINRLSPSYLLLTTGDSVFDSFLLYNTFGQIVLFEKINSNTIEVDLENYKSGVYIATFKKRSGEIKRVKINK